MARPRTFDEETVLASAMAVFWERGYQATSFDDLVVATGLGRGSLTAAFGDKEHLFAKVLDHYIRERTGRVLGLDLAGSATSKLKTLLHSWIGMTKPEEGPCGCFLLLSGVSGDAPDFARRILLQSQRELQAMLAGIIAEGQRSGEFQRNSAPDRLAAFCVVVLQGVAATARSGWSADELHAAASDALRHVVGPARRAKPATQIPKAHALNAQTKEG